MVHTSHKDHLRIAVIHQDHDYFGKLIEAFSEYPFVRTQQITAVDKLSQHAQQGQFDIALVADTVGNLTGLEVIKQIIALNPFVNCALVSPLYPDEFHHATEGFGVFMQIPVKPTRTTTPLILEKIFKIIGPHITPRDSS